MNFGSLVEGYREWARRTAGRRTERAARGAMFAIFRLHRRGETAPDRPGDARSIATNRRTIE